MIDAAGNLAKIEVSFSRFVVKVINPGWRGKQVCVLENVTEFLPVEQVLTIIPAPPVIPAMPPIVMQPSPENFGEVVISTDHKGRCVAVTRQDDDGHVIKTIWMKKKKKDK